MSVPKYEGQIENPLPTVASESWAAFLQAVATTVGNGFFNLESDMARIRTIKPEFWVSDQVVQCDVHARLLYIGLWNFCDDRGVHPLSTKRLKMEVYPGDPFTDEQICTWVAQLMEVGLIASFEHENKWYWYVTGWDHQKIDRPNNKYPAPNSTSARRTLDESSTSDRPRKGREGKGRESKGDICTSADVPACTKSSYSEAFEQWWAVYPRKIGKGRASTAWAKACKQIAPDKLLEVTIQFAGSDKGKGEYCPYPATWLQQARWDDDPTEWAESHGPKPVPPPKPEIKLALARHRKAYAIWRETDPDQRVAALAAAGLSTDDLERPD